MLLKEIFDGNFYDEINRQLKSSSMPTSHESMDRQDFIISAYEAGEITFDEALLQLEKITPSDQMFFWKHELNMADELKKC